jgi:hypothetical protein
VPTTAKTTFSASASVVYNAVTYDVEDDADEQASTDVDSLNTDLSITSYILETSPGGNAELTVTECNYGSVNLTDVSVEVTADSTHLVTLTSTIASPAYGDSTDPGVLNPGECWTWNITNVPELHPTVSVDTTFNASANVKYGGQTYTSANDADEQDSVLVKVKGGATRTWGFWKTHLFLVNWMLDPAGGNVTLPIYFGNWTGVDKYVTDNCTYMALMWANQANNSDGGKREKIDQARIHTAHQALAAIMNSYMPGGAPLPDGITLTSIANNLTNGTEKEIRDLGSALANYNESHEDVAFDPSLPPTGKVSGNIADPQGGRLVGAPCKTYWDTPEVIKAQGKGKGK